MNAPAKNAFAIYGNFPATTGATQYGNVADSNCIDGASAPATGGYGVSFGSNTVASPSYANRATGDFRLSAGSACLGQGPQSIQPVAAPATPPAPVDPDEPPKSAVVNLPERAYSLLTFIVGLLVALIVVTFLRR